MMSPTEQKPEFHPKHQTHKESILKFSALLLILIVYFLYMSSKFDAATGGSLALLTWSFFVLCTPVADAGFLLAFPIRLLFQVKMMVTQVVLWFVAISINIIMLLVSRHTYQLTFPTRLLEHIITQPYPYWSIIIISSFGTFLSIYFADELMDVTKHKHRMKNHRHGFIYKVVLTIGLGLLTVIAYYHLLSSLGIDMPT